jgi:hypothetical protein
MLHTMQRAQRALRRALGVVVIMAVSLGVPTLAGAAPMGLIISEYMADPHGDDLAKEYVELIATRSIDFSITPYSVIFCNNGNAQSAGWAYGQEVTYGFSITTGTVSAGDVVYVGGSGMAPTGEKLRVIDIVNSNGDRLGLKRPTNGALGNGGSHADGIAIFDVHIDLINHATVPIDAILHGDAVGNARFSDPNRGYQLPVNEFYNGGKIKSNSFILPSPVTGKAFIASGIYDSVLQQWVTPRTFTIGDMTDGTSAIQVLVPIPVPLPAAAWTGLALLGAICACRAARFRLRASCQQR